VTGTSFVVNGVDPDLINLNLARLDLRVENFGLSSLFAYELPLLRRYFLPAGRPAFVYLYHPWSFQDEIEDTLLPRRWDTREAARLFRPGDLTLKRANNILEGALTETCFVYRYRELLAAQVKRAVVGRLKPLPYPWDYEPSPGVMAQWPKFTEPVPRSQLSGPGIRWHQQSENNPDTIGWRGLDRFAQLCQERGVRLIVIPVPLMPSEPFLYGQFYDVRRIDARVAEVCARHGAYVLPRAELPPLQDGHFFDPWHVNTEGRIAFSRWLGQKLPELLAPEGHGHDVQ
jgi:hypothetical protein